MKIELSNELALVIKQYLLKDKTLTIKEIKTLYNENVMFRLSIDMEMPKLSIILTLDLLYKCLCKNNFDFDYQICEINKIF
jgi:hypothetical protein